MDNFWAVVFKEMTEPYMSKYQKEKVFNKIKRMVFEERSAQIKKAKNMGSSLTSDKRMNVETFVLNEINLEPIFDAE